MKAEKFEEQMRIIQKKLQTMECQYDICIEDLYNQTGKEWRRKPAMPSKMSQL